MSLVRSNFQIWGMDFPIGDEWDAGATKPHVPTDKAGRWTVRRESECFIVVFRRFADGTDILLDCFPPTEQGEIDAKTRALAARENNQTQQNKEN